jgi:pimeloyl-ACP methyl ester carboxylesterase
MPIYRGAVISVHGMRTYGAWQKDINTALTDKFFRHAQIDYGYQIRRVMRPFTKGLLEEVVAKVISAYEDQKRFELPASAIGHSFGTLVIGSALRWTPDLKLHRIVLFASILPRSFPWESLMDRGQVQKVLNESCAADPWPRRAGYWISGAGSSGCYGFRPTNERIREEAHEWTEHSRLGTHLHCSSRWIPFLL